MKKEIKKVLIVLMIMLISLSMLTACGRSNTDANATNGSKEIVFASTTDVVGLSPILTNDSASTNVTNQLYETLFTRTYDNFNEVVPLLADSYETPDELTWVIKLKEGIKFHDGTDFNAEAVKFTFERLLDPEVAAPRASILKAVDTIEVVDTYTVKLTTKYPYGAMLACLAHQNTAIVSPTAVEAQGDVMIQPVGTGAFKFEEYVPGDHVTIVKNEEYWGEASKLDKVTFKVVPEVSSVVAMMETGEADFMVTIPPEQLARLQGNSDVNVVIDKGTRVTYLGFNHGNSPLDNILVRQAIAYAVDEAAYIDTLNGLGISSDGLIGPSVFGYTDDIEGKGYEYNPEKAKDLLAQAGYSDGLTLEFTVANRPDYMPLAEIIQAQLAEVGITAELNVMEWGAFLSATKEHLFDITLLGWSNSTADGSELLYPNFHPDNIGAGNRSQYKNPEFVELVNQSRESTDQEARLEALSAANKLFVEDVAAIPMSHTAVSFAIAKKLQNVQVKPNGIFDMKYFDAK